jgi:hypothetical protein
MNQRIIYKFNWDLLNIAYLKKQGFFSKEKSDNCNSFGNLYNQRVRLQSVHIPFKIIGNSISLFEYTLTL